MLRKSWWLGLALLTLSFNSGCRLFCDRYCEGEWERERYYRNRDRGYGCGPQCPPGCAPTAGYGNYGGSFIPPQNGCN
jgi:hypothetical protein